MWATKVRSSDGEMGFGARVLRPASRCWPGAVVRATSGAALRAGSHALDGGARTTLAYSSSLLDVSAAFDIRWTCSSAASMFPSRGHAVRGGRVDGYIVLRPDSFCDELTAADAPARMRAGSTPSTRSTAPSGHQHREPRGSRADRPSRSVCG